MLLPTVAALEHLIVPGVLGMCLLIKKMMYRDATYVGCRKHAQKLASRVGYTG